MRFLRTWLAVVLAVAVFAPASFHAYANEEMGRATASKKSQAKQKKKKKKKKAKAHSAKRKVAKKKKASAAHKSHAPTTAPNSGITDIPHEKKDDLPPPAVPQE